MDPELEALLSQMDPDTLQQLLGLGTLDERGQLLQQQQAQVDALRQPRGQQYASVGGAIGGGLGDLVRGIGGGIAAGNLNQQQQMLLGQKDAGRAALVAALRAGGKKPTLPGPMEGSAGMGDIPGAYGFS